MKIDIGGRTVHLTYSTNVHPSDSITEINSFIADAVTPLKSKIHPDGPFGLGLHLPAGVVAVLKNNEYRRWEWDLLFESKNLYPFTLNCFPYGGFQSERVKEKVFAPDWTTPERLSYTKDAADLLARWLPEGVRGSISTHTGAYGKRKVGDRIWELICENLVNAALHLHRIEKKDGKQIMLALEPEPFAIVEDTSEFIAFYRDHLLPFAVSFLQARWGMDAEEAEKVIRRHVGVCFDTCHLSVQFEDLAGSLAAYQSEGIPLAKVQLSVALVLEDPQENPDGVEAIKKFAEPRFFHQAVMAGFDQEIGGRCADLPEALSRGDLLTWWQLRTHFHVPIYWGGSGGLKTTREDLEPVLGLLADSCDHLEIETYTWDVIPEAERAAIAPDLVTSLENEYRWVLERIR